MRREMGMRAVGILMAGLVAVSTARADGFLANAGQLDRDVLFYGAGARGTVFLTRDAIVLEIVAPTDEPERRPSLDLPYRTRELRPARATRRHALRIGFEGASRAGAIEGVGALPGRRRFVTGRERERAVDVPAYSAVVYRNLWRGVDLEVAERAGELSWRLLSANDTDLSHVRFLYDGATRVDRAVDADLLTTPVAVVSVERPQPGRRRGSIGFREPAPAPSAPEPVRDPGSLGFSTFLGGERDDAVYASAIGADGRILVAGATRSLEFPATAGALDTSYGGSFDAFVTLLEPDGHALVWSTFLGGSADDRAWAVAVDSASRPVIAGVSASTDFPVTSGAFDESHNGSYDAFVTCLSADGSALVWSTYLGGAGSEWDVSGLVLDTLGRATVTGSTRSADFPTTSGAFDETLSGPEDAFAARLSVDGSALEFATLLGGGGLDVAEDVALDDSDRPVIVGRTWSTDFPTTAGAFQDALAGTPDQPDAFVARLTAAGDGLDSSTFLGGGLDDEALAVAVDANGRPVVTGSTSSIDFPTTPGAYSRSYAGNRDVFVARLEADGSGLVWSTFFGGGGGERGLDLALTDRDHPVLVGYTCSEDFPVAGAPFDDAFSGPCDAFVASFGRNGSQLDESTFVGGWYDESAYALSMDALERPVVSGETLSSDFPVTAAAYDPDHGSPDEWFDGFVLRIAPKVVCVAVSGATAPELSLAKAPGGGSCPPAVTGSQSIDLVEGRLENLGPGGLGELDPVSCGSGTVVFATDTVPSPGRALFLLARYGPTGTYADAAGATLVGSRVPGPGDCP